MPHSSNTSLLSTRNQANYPSTYLPTYPPTCVAIPPAHQCYLPTYPPTHPRTNITNLYVNQLPPNFPPTYPSSHLCDEPTRFESHAPSYSPSHLLIPTCPPTRLIYLPSKRPTYLSTLQSSYVTYPPSHVYDLLTYPHTSVPTQELF